MSYRPLTYIRPPERSEPPWRISVIGGVVGTASYILARTDSDYVNSLLQHVNAALKPLFWTEFKQIEIRPSENLVRYTAGPAMCLWRHRSEVDRSAWPECHESEIFAALALGLASSVFRYEKLVTREDEGTVESAALEVPQLTNDQEIWAHASEAITIAQLLFESDEAHVPVTTDKEKAKRQSIAAQKNFRRAEAVYQKWLNFYDDHHTNYSTKAACARHFYFNVCDRSERALICRSSKNPEMAAKRAARTLVRKVRERDEALSKM